MLDNFLNFLRMTIPHSLTFWRYVPGRSNPLKFDDCRVYGCDVRLCCFAELFS